MTKHTDGAPHPCLQHLTRKTTNNVSPRAVDDICGPECICLRPKIKRNSHRNLKLNASKHVLAWRQVHLSAVAAHCVAYQMSHESARVALCGQMNENRSVSYRSAFSHYSPSSRFAVQTSVEPLIPVRLSLPLSYFSAAAEQSHASSSSRHGVTSAGEHVRPTPP